jgi:biotin carboxyl carrier protein
MKRYQITLEGQTFDVLLRSDPQQERVQVEVDGIAFTAEVKVFPAGQGSGVETAEQAEPSTPAETPAAVQAPIAQVSTTTSNIVTAPLPGVLKSIAVRPGQRVSTGDPLFVIEAMKMDNIIRASRDATVEAVLVGEGRQVGYGERLLEYQSS